MCLKTEHERMKEKSKKKSKSKRDTVYKIVSTFPCFLTNIIERIVWKYSSNHPHHECRVSLKIIISKNTMPMADSIPQYVSVLTEQIAPHFI